MRMSTTETRTTRLARRLVVMAAAGVTLALLPAAASAQAIGGTVSDTTGGVLPGVTVEARSPALIEQVRTAVTDGNGQYQIVALETGTYSVTFTLPGFSTLVREGVELESGFTANIDVELAVGALEETVIVTEATPLIDVQTIESSEVIDREVYETLPTARTYDAMALLIPAMNIAGGPTTTISVDTGGIGGKSNNRLTIHGSTEDDAQVEIDGLDVSLVAFPGSPQGTPFDSAISEYVYDYSGNSAEIETGGVRLNMIPKEGSNTFTGSFYGDFSHPDLLANNVDQDLIDLGLPGGEEGGNRLDQVWYTGASVGGPIVQDDLWFYASYSYRRSSLLPPGLFANLDSSSARYVENLDEPMIKRENAWEGTLRLTWQATSKDKLQAFYSNNNTARIPSLTGAELDPIYIAPEAGSDNSASTNLYVASWIRPHTNRLLFEFGASSMPTGIDLLPLVDVPGRPELQARPDLPSVFEGTTLTMSRNMGFFFGGNSVHFSTRSSAWRGSVSYVTGSHNLKIGVQGNYRRQTEAYEAGNNWTNMITVFGRPLQAQFNARPASSNALDSYAVYAQEQWTIDRFTINAGLRFDYFKGFYPDQVTQAMTWAPVPQMVPGRTVAGWKDLQPRVGFAWDVRGDGQTAVKASASRYGDLNSIVLARDGNPTDANRTTSRLWLDGANSHLALGPLRLPSCIPSAADPTASNCIAGDGIVQGDALNPFPNGEIMQPLANLGFAHFTESAVAFDEDWAFGWNKKAANWEVTASVQQQLADGVSVDAGYFRRIFVNLEVVDDLAVAASDWDEYQFTAPDDPRLPDDVRGQRFTLVDLNPAALAAQQNLTTSADNFGGRVQTWHGVDVNLSARVEGVLLQGGMATGKQTEDQCAVQAALPESINQGAGGLTGGGDSVIIKEFCATETPWITQASLFGSYTLPWDIELAGTWFARSGTPRLAVHTVQVSEAAAALGRTPTETSINVNLLRPGTAYGDRLYQFDLRLAKLLRFGAGSNLRVSFDLYNLFNANAVSRERYTLREYLQPVGLQPGRMGKFTLQYNF